MIIDNRKGKNYENKLRGVDLKLAYPREVDSLMFNLLASWNELASPTLKDIADFHYQFELIHPFQDGNGRIGRFIILKQCLESNIDLIAIDDEFDEEYRNALYIAQKTKNSDRLAEVFRKCQQKLDQKFVSYKDVIEQIDFELNSTNKTLKRKQP